MPPEFPIPLRAVYLAAPPDEFIRVTFNEPLVPVAQPDFVARDWKIWYNDWSSRSVGGWITGTDVFVRFVRVSNIPHEDVISYNARARQVVSAHTGSPAKPFSDFPIKTP